MSLRYYARVSSEGNRYSVCLPSVLVRSNEVAREAVEAGWVVVSFNGLVSVSKVRRKVITDSKGYTYEHYRITVPRRVVEKLGLKVGDKVLVELSPLSR